MKALITGARGFVGPHLIEHLRAAGDEVTAFDLQNGPDLKDAAGWRRSIGETRPEVVYHLAGWSDVGASWNSPAETFAVNTLGTVHILEAARAADVSVVVLVSSADVYGTVSLAELPLTEISNAQPRSPYGASKLAAETIGLQYFRGHGLNVVTVRPFNHLGPGQSTRFAAPSFASQIAAFERTGGGTLRHGDLTPLRDLTDVRDVVRAYRLVALEGRAGEVYNVCSGRSIPMQSLLDLMLESASAEITCEIDPALLRTVEIPVLSGSYAKLGDATGWGPEYTLEATVADVLEDARARASRLGDPEASKVGVDD